MEEAESAEGLGEGPLRSRDSRAEAPGGWVGGGAGQPRARACPSFLFSTALGSRQEHSSRMSQDMGKGITWAGHKQQASVKGLRFYAF